MGMKVISSYVKPPKMVHLLIGILQANVRKTYESHEEEHE